MGAPSSPSGGSAPIRRRRRIVLAAVALAALSVVLGAALSWHYSSAVLVPRHQDYAEDVEVEGLAAGRVELARTEESSRPGVFGLVWQGGHAIVGDPVVGDGDSVTRPIRDLRGYLAPGMEVAIESEVWAGDPGERGLPFADVDVRGELGPMPAWLIPARGRTWAIVAHGINGFPEAGLRIAPTLRRAGLPSLLITYRDDLGAPSSPDGKHHMGLTEWRDVEAAARFALRRGARRLVLIGYSMGGSLIAQFMQRSRLAPRVAGLVLDAPALDWQEILSFNATEMGLPGFLAKPVEWAIDARIEVDWESLDAARHPEDFQLPILLLHGTEDSIVPISISEEFAAALPRVTYYHVPGADHTQSWNVEPRLYERRLRAFLAEIGARESS